MTSLSLFIIHLVPLPHSEPGFLSLPRSLLLSPVYSLSLSPFSYLVSNPGCRKEVISSMNEKVKTVVRKRVCTFCVYLCVSMFVFMPADTWQEAENTPDRLIGSQQYPLLMAEQRMKWSKGKYLFKSKWIIRADCNSLSQS